MLCPAVAGFMTDREIFPSTRWLWRRGPRDDPELNWRGSATLALNMPPSRGRGLAPCIQYAASCCCCCYLPIDHGIDCGCGAKVELPQRREKGSKCLGSRERKLIGLNPITVSARRPRRSRRKDIGIARGQHV